MKDNAKKYNLTANMSYHMNLPPAPALLIRADYNLFNLSLALLPGQPN